MKHLVLSWMESVTCLLTSVLHSDHTFSASLEFSGTLGVGHRSEPAGLWKKRSSLSAVLRFYSPPVCLCRTSALRTNWKTRTVERLWGAVLWSIWVTTETCCPCSPARASSDLTPVKILKQIRLCLRCGNWFILCMCHWIPPIIWAGSGTLWRHCVCYV